MTRKQFHLNRFHFWPVWMENIFKDIYSTNDEARKAAHQTLLISMENPDFITQLFEILKSVDNSNLLLLQSICITIQEMLKIKWNTNFFSNEIKQNIFVQILDVIFSLPYEVRPIVQWTISSIFININEFIESIINSCLAQINSDSLFNISTSLLILHDLFFNATYNKKPSSTFNIDKFRSILLPILFQITSNSVQIFFIDKDMNLNLKNSDDVVDSIISSISSIMILFIRRPQHETIPVIIQILALLISCLEIEKLSKSKSIICDLIINCMFTPQKVDQITLNFKRLFIADCTPLVAKSLANCFLFKLESQILSKCFTVLQNLISQNLFTEQFIHPSFITNILIPSSYLTNEDISVFVDIPEQFLNFCYNLNNEYEEITSRISIYKLLQTIGKKINPAIDMIIECCLTPSQNPIEFESKLYILSCIVNFRSNNLTIYQYLMNILTNTDNSFSNSPFIISSTIAALREMNIDLITMNKMSLIILIQNPFIVIKIMALYLFRKTFQPPNTKIEISLIDLLHSLLELTNSVKDSAPLIMIDMLIMQYPDSILQIAGELISALINMWINLVGTLGEEKGRDLLSSITKLFQRMPQNSPLFMNMANEIVLFVCKAIKEFSDSYYIDEYVDIFLVLLEKIDEPPPQIFVTIVTFLIEYIYSDLNDLLCWMCIVVKVFNLILQKSNFHSNSFNNQINNQVDFPISNQISNEIKNQLISAMINLCFSVIENNHDSSNIKATASSLFLLSTIVQVGQPSFTQLIEKSLQFFSIPNIHEETTLFVSAFCLFSSCLISDSDNSLKYANDDLLNFLFSHLTPFNGAEFNQISLCFLGICILAKSGNKNAYLCAIQLLPILVKKKKYETIDDDESSDENSMETPPYQHPSDQINPFVFFRDVSNYQSGFFQELPDDIKQYIINNVFIQELLL
ncbi:hypothetical protein TRFO_38957 [Tritrichomonas foetus]|uniref:Importin N-terminal domain-containing protein n=1 Tax=Tritrichomonas foetus TaxID=1144522 RepID=A0A1J4JB07_9EUKA|nr:hypothetical protein TRFO_38957 [Tritrichomonas foetus]|eukprot:OHS94835.1 hypothetical protein TRFO_38957 [Tritrichomonas foetus]